MVNVLFKDSHSLWPIHVDVEVVLTVRLFCRRNSKSPQGKSPHSLIRDRVCVGGTRSQFASRGSHCYASELHNASGFILVWSKQTEEPTQLDCFLSPVTLESVVVPLYKFNSTSTSWSKCRGEVRHVVHSMHSLVSALQKQIKGWQTKFLTLSTVHFSLHFMLSEHPPWEMRLSSEFLRALSSKINLLTFFNNARKKSEVGPQRFLWSKGLFLIGFCVCCYGNGSLID